jgi:hypothetical protein
MMNMNESIFNKLNEFALILFYDFSYLIDYFMIVILFLNKEIFISAN